MLTAHKIYLKYTKTTIHNLVPQIATSQLNGAVCASY